MDLLSDEQLWKILQSQDDTPYVVDPEEYALLEKLEKNARKVDNDKETTIHRNTENLIRSVSIRNLGSDYESLGKQVLQEQRVVEQKDYSGSFETIDEDLLVFALDSVEQQYLSSNRTENSKQLVTNSVNQPSWQVYSNQRQFVSCSKTSFETNSNENELEKPDSLCETGVRPQKQSIERYLPTISPSSNNIASSNSCAELTSPKIRNFQTTLDSVTDCLWFPSKSSKKLSQNVSLDIDAARSWIFPTNIPERAYQFNIVRSALACNTLVCLPTGLGKTFIAAVVMYNFLRWYPEGKVVFMAPTKPLVRQQIAACYRVVGIPIEATAEMTGTMKAEIRETMWKSKNAFFVTPQIMKNDIDRGICPASKVVCVVFDEAHKATGRYVYCSLVEDLNKATGGSYRILALSATPGNSVSVIQQVINNLQIAKVEFRSEDDPDTKPYTFHRQIESIVVPLSSDLQEVKILAMDLLSPLLHNLCSNHAFYERSAERASVMKLLSARETWRQNFTPQTKEDHTKRSFILSQFSLAVSLCYGINLLYSHGLAPFDSFLESFESESKQKTGRLKKLIVNREKFKILRSMTTDLIGKGVTHPKALRCVEVLRNHFIETSVSGATDTLEEKVSSRAIVFAQYRESVVELRRILAQHEPLIHAMCFVGQAPSASSYKSERTSGMSQKEQIEVLREFRKGTFNVLVSTSIGEEGLDIADVDLIISYDVISSPVRMLQRMGRTGRARAGQIVVLLTEGCEETRMSEMNRRASSIAKSLREKLNCFSLYEESPRMIPTDGQTVHCERKELSIEDIKFSGEDSVFPLHSKRCSLGNAWKGSKKNSFESVANAVESVFLENHGLGIKQLPRTKLSTKHGVREFFLNNNASSNSNSTRPNISKVGRLRNQTIALIEHIASGSISCQNINLPNNTSYNEVSQDFKDSQNSNTTTSSKYAEPVFPGLPGVNQSIEDLDNSQGLYERTCISEIHKTDTDLDFLGKKSSADTEEDSYLEAVCSPPDEKLEVEYPVETLNFANSTQQECKVEDEENKQHRLLVDEKAATGNENASLGVLQEEDELASGESPPILRVKKRHKQERQLSPVAVGSKRIRAPRKIRLIQSQASVSSDDYDGEDDNYEEEELGSLADFLVEDSESQSQSLNENDSVSSHHSRSNMHSIYLRSLLSPENHKLGFVSPPRFGKPANKGAMKMGLTKK